MKVFTYVTLNANEANSYIPKLCFKNNFLAIRKQDGGIGLDWRIEWSENFLSEVV